MGGYGLRLLLDTSVWIRGALSPSTIPGAIRKLLEAQIEAVGLSSISIWEVGKKHQQGKLPLQEDLLPWLRKALATQIEVLPITAEVVADATGLPEFPVRDPADELIVATARVNNLLLLTTDTKLKSYPHAKIKYFTPILNGE
jgi:PIN domain nuclease of toxin-antitoxin system